MSDKAKKKQVEATLLSVCESLRSGISFTRSCSVSGISKQTGFAWRNSGWDAIETEAEGSDEPLPFVARFALETELALADFQRPLIQRIRDGADGKTKGDWRAAQQLLASRFPDEFSEKVHAAKSGKLEVSGQIDVSHAHAYQQFLAIRNLSMEELALETARLESQINHTPISGGDLDARIAVLEGKLSSMREAAASGHGWVAANWLVVGEPAIRPAVPEIIDLDEFEVTNNPAATDTPADAPIEAGAEFVLSSASAAPPLSSGIAYDAITGLAYHPPVEDEDLTTL